MDTTSWSHSSGTKRKQSFKSKPVNPIEEAIRIWFEQLPSELSAQIQIKLEELIFRAPKRWVVYLPLVLLPSGSYDEEWWDLLRPAVIQTRYKHQLWKIILEKVGRREGKGILTHLAVNVGIPLHKRGDPEEKNEDGENILRTPSGLAMLYGDFGPDLNPTCPPSEQDFAEAFWVSTKQNGITQIWAPRYTMFSRGNIKEKARLLDFHRRDNPILSRRPNEAEPLYQTAVDLYAGIGYFVFSYVKMGMWRVIGWELNPWSVEGLRRGALANGWPVKIIRSDEKLNLGNEKIIVVLGDNKLATERLKEVALTNISHINCGLLPSSEATWKMAMEILNRRGWLHLHENVGVDAIESRGTQIEDILRAGCKKEKEVKVEHIERVKTFAPGVWHCVFDVYLSRIPPAPTRYIPTLNLT
jgi:tRNA wybutosine-synthesizing protein 2